MLDVSDKRPWFIRVETGVLHWPPLLFPFTMRGAGTDEGERATREAAKAAKAAALAYYRHDDTASFAPSLWLLGPDQNVIHALD